MKFDMERPQSQLFYKQQFNFIEISCPICLANLSYEQLSIGGFASILNMLQETSFITKIGSDPAK